MGQLSPSEETSGDAGLGDPYRSGRVQRLSPLAIPNKTGTPYGDVLWREMQEFLKTERLDQDTVAAGIDAAHHLIVTISGEALKTNRYLNGLIH